ncbi:hypothetical protein Lfu02_64220 [Longispora fulva]|nr:hypothetical protein Lfu02_64220 [Longispora fulva]
MVGFALLGLIGAVPGAATADPEPAPWQPATARPAPPAPPAGPRVEPATALPSHGSTASASAPATATAGAEPTDGPGATGGTGPTSGPGGSAQPTVPGATGAPSALASAVPVRPRAEETHTPPPTGPIPEPRVDPGAFARGQAVLRAGQAYREAADARSRLTAAEAALARDTERVRTDAGLPGELYRRSAAVPSPLRGPWWELRRATVRLPADRGALERALTADATAVRAGRVAVERADRRAREVAARLDPATRVALEAGARAVPPGPDRLLAPVPGTVTSGFGTRMDPYFQRVAPHAGVDLAAAAGAPVLAAAAGRVLRAGWADGYGYYTCIDHPDRRVWTCYAHQSVILVRPGEQVRAGQVIGLAGSTGASTGPHVHFEVRRGGSPVDPAPWLAH